MQVAFEFFVALEVAVGLLHNDLPLEQEPFKHFLNVKPGVMGIACPEGDVLQIEEHRHGRVGIRGAHLNMTSWP